MRSTRFARASGSWGGRSSTTGCGRTRPTLEEIGNRWGISRERVRQVEVKTKQLLHQHLERLETVATRDAA
jgi:DNA-directed RNA polymerase sigma subunit (sigma70/sigma32)